jgi:hypothetical protein
MEPHCFFYKYFNKFNQGRYKGIMQLLLSSLSYAIGPVVPFRRQRNGDSVPQVIEISLHNPCASTKYPITGGLSSDISCIEVVPKAPITPNAITMNDLMFFKNNFFIVLNFKLHSDLIFSTSIGSNPGYLLMYILMSCKSIF